MILGIEVRADSVKRNMMIAAFCSFFLCAVCERMRIFLCENSVGRLSVAVTCINAEAVINNFHNCIGEAHVLLGCESKKKRTDCGFDNLANLEICGESRSLFAFIVNDEIAVFVKRPVVGLTETGNNYCWIIFAIAVVANVVFISCRFL